MLSKRIFGFWNLLTELTLVAWVGNVSGFNVLSEVGLFAAFIWTVITVPEMSILAHFTLYFSFNIYKTTKYLRFLLTMFLDVLPPPSNLNSFCYRRLLGVLRNNQYSAKFSILPFWNLIYFNYNMYNTTTNHIFKLG